MDGKTPLKIKDWANEDKPREKLMTVGKKTLSDAELLAILLGSGSVGESAVDLAKRLLADSDNDLNTLRNNTISDLTRYRGMGEAKAVTVTAALELGYRLISQQSHKKVTVVRNSQDIFDYIAPSIIDLPHEEFWAIMLNVSNKILGKFLISKGGNTETGVDIRIVFRKALEAGASGIAVAHNHPSGNLNPSKQDKELTRRIVDAGHLLRIPLVDHLIVGIGDDGLGCYYSFVDHNLL